MIYYIKVADQQTLIDLCDNKAQELGSRFDMASHGRKWFWVNTEFRTHGLSDVCKSTNTIDISDFFQWKTLSVWNDVEDLLVKLNNKYQTESDGLFGLNKLIHRSSAASFKDAVKIVRHARLNGEIPESWK